MVCPKDIREVSFAHTSKERMEEGPTLKIANDVYTQHVKNYFTKDWQHEDWKRFRVGENKGFDEAVSHVMVKLLRHRCKGTLKGFHHVKWILEGGQG